ncbi:MAG: ABC transporter permease [Alphaproteobacteria bacterium]
MSTSHGGVSGADVLRAEASRVDLRTVVLLPTVAVASALVLGAVIMLATGIAPATVRDSYVALVQGSLGSVYAVSETLTAAAPLILAGLGVAVGFRAGLFNIGAEGQILVGGMASLIAGFSLTGLPIFLHLPLAIAAGALVGGAWGMIAGWLRAATGAHEVISTIMLNFIALRLVDFLLRNPPVQKPGRDDPISRSVLDSANLPTLLGWLEPQYRLNAGIFLAVIMVVVIAWLLFHTTIGFEFRAAGANADAARCAGIRLGRTIVAVMFTAGGLAGLAGATQVLGVLGRASPGFSAGLGFEAIAVALLGRSHPWGVLMAGLLFGALEAGGRQMQVSAGVSIDLITIIQALIVVFVAAPMLIRSLYPMLFREKAK